MEHRLTACVPTPQGYDVAAPLAKQAVDTVTPAVVEAARKTVELAQPALEAAAPAFSVRIPSGTNISTLHSIVPRPHCVWFDEHSRSVSSSTSYGLPGSNHQRVLLP